MTAFPTRVRWIEDPPDSMPGERSGALKVGNGGCCPVASSGAISRSAVQQFSDPAQVISANLVQHWLAQHKGRAH